MRASPAFFVMATLKFWKYLCIIFRFVFTFVIKWHKKYLGIKKKIIDFNTTLVPIEEVPDAYRVNNNVFRIPAIIYGRGIQIKNVEFEGVSLRYKYKKMRGCFNPRNIYRIDIVDVDENVYKSYYTRLKFNEFFILWYHFFWKNVKSVIRKTLKSSWEIFNKHIFKIIIIALLAWFSMNGLKSCTKIVEKTNVGELFEKVNIEILK